jgi:hypothetical protein
LMKAHEEQIANRDRTEARPERSAAADRSSST